MAYLLNEMKDLIWTVNIMQHCVIFNLSISRCNAIVFDTTLCYF